MANSLEIKMAAVGVEDVEKALKHVRWSVRARILKMATAYAIKPMVPAVKSHAPHGAGALAKSIISRVKRYTRGDSDQAYAVGMVGPESKFKMTIGDTDGFAGRKQRIEKPSKYAHLVEFGTRKHFIPAPGYGRKNRKTFISRIRHLVGANPGWDHPGASAHPFITPVAESMRSTVIARFRERALERVKIEYNSAKAKGKKFWRWDK